MRDEGVCEECQAEDETVAEYSYVDEGFKGEEPTHVHALLCDECADYFMADGW